jgi:hypothetical protein
MRVNSVSIFLIYRPIPLTLYFSEAIIQLHLKIHGAWLGRVPCEHCPKAHIEKFCWAACGGPQGLRDIIEHYLRLLNWPIRQSVPPFLFYLLPLTAFLPEFAFAHTFRCLYLYISLYIHCQPSCMNQRTYHKMPPYKSCVTQGAKANFIHCMVSNTSCTVNKKTQLYTRLIDDRVRGAEC